MTFPQGAATQENFPYNSVVMEALESGEESIFAAGGWAIVWRGRLPREILRETRESYASRETSHLRRDETEIRIDCALGTNPLGVAPGVRAFLQKPQPWDPSPYPSAVGMKLRAEIAAYLGGGLSPEAIVLGHGSFDVLTHLLRILLPAGALLGGVSPQFTDVPLHAMLHNVRYHPVVLRPPLFEADQESWRRAIRIHPHVLYIDRPHNPTGQVLPLDVLEEICALGARQGTWVVADEAYGEYLPLEEGAVTLLAPNLVVTRSFSKAWGLAGARVGYGIIRDPELREIFRKTQAPFPVSTPGMVLASVALEDRNFLEMTRRYVVEAKTRILKMVTSGEAVTPAVTDGRTPILVLSTLRGDLCASFDRMGVGTEPGGGYIDLDARSVRLRVPPPDSLEALLAVLQRMGDDGVGIS